MAGVRERNSGEKLTKSSSSTSRMRDFFSRIPLPKWHPDSDPILGAHLTRIANMDIAFQQKMKRLNKLIPWYVQLRMRGGSGFRMAGILRHFFLEYLNRLLEHGPYSLPSSFNIIEGFLSFDKEFFVFDLRKEREHLLSIFDYFDWYTSENKLPDDPRILKEILEEGIVYSYDIAGDTGEYVSTSEDSQIIIAGISMIRHGNELSVLLLSAENPPYPSDSEIESNLKMGKHSQGHEGIVPAEDLSLNDRYLEGLSGYSKVLMLSRYDLQFKKFDVRYINLDIGKGYRMFTDDFENLFESSDSEEDIKRLTDMQNIGLERYKHLFSVTTSLIYLPVMFISEAQRVVDTKFTTEFHASESSYEKNKIAKEFGRSEVVQLV